MFLSAPLADVTDAVGAVRRLMFLAALPALLLAALLGLYLSRSIARPLRRLSDAAVQIAGGDYRQRIELKSADEFGYLAQNFNRMAMSLEETVGALAREKEKIENILANMAEGVVAVDGSSRVILLNRQAIRTLGLGESADLTVQLYGEPVPDSQLKELFAAVLASGETCSREYTPDDGHSYFLVHVSPLIDQAGNNFGAVGVLQDITELKKLDQLRRDFVANVSHELRTPLTSVQGYVEAMLDRAIPSEDRGEPPPGQARGLRPEGFKNVQVIRHGFHLDECVSVSVADFLDCRFYDVFYLAGNYLVPVFWAKHDMVIDVVDTVVRFSIHTMIIVLERVFVNTLVALTGDAPLDPPHKGVGFQGRFL
ncbi:HAMP domain-containing protein [Desulfofundulus thermosubterraneus]|uniref:HAMP domain-containing protein n=1 Tax=Desulfofundulus thermosubterraneus TaxID=348840 RepID=UPI000A05329F|nr:HAMP domain-containing protein [Desulfofundulus thermosubterraneus]